VVAVLAVVASTAAATSPAAIVSLRSPAASLAYGDGTVWLADSRGGTVTRVSPPTGRVFGHPIAVGVQPVAIVVEPDVAWVEGADGRLARIDANTDRLVGTPIPTGLPHRAGPIAVGDGSVWIAKARRDRRPAVLERIDIASMSATRTSYPGVRPDAIVVAPAAVWVGDAATASVYRFDPATGRRVGEPIHVHGHASALAQADGVLWVADDLADSVARFTASNGTPIGAAATVGRGPDSLALGAGAVWVANAADGTLSQLDAATGAGLANPIALPGGPSSAMIATATPEGRVWVASAGAVVSVDAALADRQAPGQGASYPYANAVCEFGAAGGPTCANPAKQDDAYDWGYFASGPFRHYDSWGYEYRNCVSYTAWRLSLAGVAPALFSDLGNADDWLAGVGTERGVIVDDNPTPGAIAAWNSPDVGHVAWVESVHGQSVVVSDYNYTQTGVYESARAVAASSASGYIHFPRG
jgi:surface antigen/streptogramin lyase